MGTTINCQWLPEGDFRLERYFAAHEFRARFIMSASDCQSLTLSEVLAVADPETAALWAELALGYTESQGHPLLRQQISSLYSGIGAGNILVAAPEECILLAMRAVLKPGDEVIAIHPAYQSLHELASAQGSQVVRWELTVEQGRWQLDVDQLESLITARTRLLVINFPHNPTGYLPTSSQQAQIVAVARRHGLWLFSDEMYWGLEFDPAERLAAACQLYERAISLSGMSKSLSMAGLRIGWLASPDQGFVDRCSRLKDYTTICSSAPSEILALIGLRSRDSIVARNRELIRRNLQATAAFFASRSELLTWIPPLAGSVAFPMLQDSWPADDFCRYVLERESVLAIPASLFDYAGNHFRVGLGRQDLPEALYHFGLAISAHQASSS